ncbi:MAG: tripartite tricarboxylate transporter substrate binding protein [Pseudorhodoplanes sp.]|nr:MAG: tripartite tricarboxylate transporter substrate binding protein [Pseudorhodoplanes sp.]
MKRRQFIKTSTAVVGAIAAAVGALAIVIPHRAAANPYPAQPVKIIVAYAAGGSTDLVARALADRFSASLKQPFVVENRPGAGGTLGTTLAAKAAPDGYTLYLGQVSSHGIAPGLYRNLQYDPVKDFAPIGKIASIPNVMVVNAKSKAHSVADFVAMAKQQPGKMNFASSGNGSSIHLSGELFKRLADVNVNHVPFRGSAPALTALVAGQVDVMFDNLPSALPHIEAGMLRALAVTTLARAQALPAAPTLAEAGKGLGLEKYDVSAWFGLFAPAGTSKTIIEKLNIELNKHLRGAELQKFLAKQGATPDPGTPDAFATFVRAELAMWAGVVKAAGITLQQ